MGNLKGVLGKNDIIASKRSRDKIHQCKSRKVIIHTCWSVINNNTKLHTCFDI